MLRPLLLAALLATSIGAQAAQTLVPQKSKLGFVFSQMNTPVDGSFKNYTATIDFDPAKPEAASAQIVIDLASIDVGGPDGNAEAKKKAWFDVAANPKGTFTATTVKALGGGKFETKGKLTIKGISREVVGQMTAKQQGAELVLEGTVPLLRLNYKLGDGAWADTGTVADEVAVKYKLVLTGKAGK
ncbi:YceI family protein [Chitinibacter bivalviorum]|uniref:YceI family protein n=1 Tax=Chitinibacter bivalviorum TaxID=2739434 RepID=A0A7H9BJ40_9NEIS|nr:YceI family protein [Chitinibacter bivalviorum]QLG88258.1 YceI family protein [Chitinibacter bivalviorum]